MRRFRRLALLAISLVVIVAIAWLALLAGDPSGFAEGQRVDLAAFNGSNPTGVPASLANAELVARGEYLARAGDCAASHTEPGGKAFAGGSAV